MYKKYCKSKLQVVKWYRTFQAQRIRLQSKKNFFIQNHFIVCPGWSGSSVLSCSGLEPQIVNLTADTLKKIQRNWFSGGKTLRNLFSTDLLVVFVLHHLDIVHLASVIRSWGQRPKRSVINEKNGSEFMQKPAYNTTVADQNVWHSDHEMKLERKPNFHSCFLGNENVASPPPPLIYASGFWY